MNSQNKTLIDLVHFIANDLPTEEAIVLIDLAESATEWYKSVPAARSNHHAYPGGLLTHTTEMVAMFEAIHKALPFNVDTFVVVASLILHDHDKILEYKDGECTDYFYLVGHVHGSAEFAVNYLKAKHVPDNTILHVEHCILAHHGKPAWGSLIPATPEAFLVHELDMLSGIGYQYTKTGSSRSLNVNVIHYK